MSKLTPEDLARMPPELRPSTARQRDVQAELQASLKVRMDNIRKDIDRQSNGMFADFDAVDPNSSPVGRVSEEIFVSYFLPLFIDPHGEDPKNTSPEYAKFKTWRAKIMKDWYLIAGSQWAEVNVYGKDKNVLFTVPAMASSKIYNPHRPRNAVSIAEIMNTASLYALQGSGKGNAIQAQGFQAKLNAMKTKGNVFEKETAMWVEIKDKYPEVQPLSETHGFVKPVDKAEAAPVVTAPPATSGADDDLVF